MKSTLKKERGIAHIGIILVVLVLAAAGFVGWWVWKNNDGSDSTVDKSIRDAIKNAKCDYDDKDLCKFFTGWEAQGSYEYRATATQDGKASKTTVKTQGKDKFYMKLEGEVAYEIIQIGNVLYTKAADGTWWKQTLPENQANTYKDNGETTFTQPDSEESEAAKITYKKIGKEKCGELTCFKYQVVDPSDTKTTTYLWFDDKDYQLRRMQTSNETYSFDSTYSYNKVTVSEPSPVKDLGANQYLVPGQTEPTTLPDTGDMPSEEELQNLLNQYQ